LIYVEQKASCAENQPQPKQTIERQQPAVYSPPEPLSCGGHACPECGKCSGEASCHLRTAARAAALGLAFARKADLLDAGRALLDAGLAFDDRKADFNLHRCECKRSEVK